MEVKIKLYQVEIGALSDYCRYEEYLSNWQKAQAFNEEHPGVLNILPLVEPEYENLSEDEIAEGKKPRSTYERRAIIEEYSKLWVTGEHFLLLAECYNVIVKSVVTKTVNIAAAFQHLAEKPQEILKGAGGDTYNQKCEVHMPGQALSVYNEVMLLEDTCTDALQLELTKGWRIIAACPQPDQRRPDYILGRFNPEKDDKLDYASRGSSK